MKEQETLTIKKPKGAPIPQKPVNVELFGHVTLIHAYDVPNFQGCHALVTLRDHPGKTVAVLTEVFRLQSLLETALETGNLISFWGYKDPNPPLPPLADIVTMPSGRRPLGGSWGVEVYQVQSIILYNGK